jgi:hypothetical protein
MEPGRGGGVNIILDGPKGHGPWASAAANDAAFKISVHRTIRLRMTRRKKHRCLFLLVLLAPTLATSGSGCVAIRNWFGGRPTGPVQCVIAEDATAHDIVMHLNENTHKLRGWKTTRARIATHGNMLVPRVDAMIYIESPKNLRLVAENPMGGKEVDLGSNDKQFWFWVRRNEDRQVIVASHDLDPERMRKFPFPFQPDWIMETMGVIEINPDEELTVQPGPQGSYLVSLIAERASPQGFKVRKVTVVDRRSGLIVEHSLWDARSQLIAKAALSGHARDKSNNAWIPMKIELEWPKAQLGLTMTLSDVDVNPQHFPKDTWTLPRFPNYEIIDLSH